MREFVATRVALVGALLVAAGCARDGLDRAALLDPGTCEGCHPDQVREWSSSMHAYASDDPVFVALDRRGQRETGGALGTLCVGCHAPMAVREGATTDGTNLADLPRELRGVTCTFCHTTADVTGDHNNPLVLGDDTMRGQLRSPVDTPAHRSAHSPWLDGADARSAQACGACHDVVTPSGLAVERTFAEWKTSLYAQPSTQLTCAQCHMKGRDARAADVRGAPVRRTTSHLWPGLDIATTPWTGLAEQRAAITADLEPSISAKLCVSPGGAVDVVLDNLASGHAWPSGVTHSRRIWVELTASAAGAALVDDTSWTLGQTLRAADGRAVEMPWDAVSADSVVLLPAVTTDPTDPRFYHAVTHHYPLSPAVDAITVRVHVQPIAQAVLDDLVASGDLDPALATATTFDIASAARDWKLADGYGCH